MTDEGSQDEGEALEEEALDAAPVPLIVPAEAAGARIDRWIAETDPTLSRSRVKVLLGEGAIRLNGVAAPSPSVKLKQGDAIEIDLPAPVPASPVPQALPLRVLFEDEHVIVLDKAAGMAVHPAPGTPDGTVVNALLA
ncbi:MAG: RluA family pseudouridine synthase, partial [Pseudomonadota bacterium]